MDDTSAVWDNSRIGTQNCFWLFYTPYANIKTSAHNSPKCTVVRQKKFCGGAQPRSRPLSSRPSPTGEADIPSSDPTPWAPSAPRLSRHRRFSCFSFTTWTLSQNHLSRTKFIGLWNSDFICMFGLHCSWSRAISWHKVAYNIGHYTLHWQSTLSEFLI